MELLIVVALTMRTLPVVRQAVDRATCLNGRWVWKTNSMMEELTVADKSRLAKRCLLPDPIRCTEPVVPLLVMKGATTTLGSGMRPRSVVGIIRLSSAVRKR